MGKRKDSSKNRKWEQVRRDRLNQTFSDLCKELPGKGNGGLLSKNAILNEAITYIHQLQREKKELHDSLCNQRPSQQNGNIPDISELRSHIDVLLRRQAQLSQLLQDAGISVPRDPSADNVSAKWACGVFQTVSVQSENRDASPLEKKKKDSSPGNITQPNGALNRVVYTEKTNSVNSLPRKNKDQSPKKKISKRTVPQAPLVLQSLPPQLVLTPSAASSTVPVIMSMTGVKTINPVILVQSKPLLPCNTSTSFTTRPIRPTPAVKPSGTRAKVPIPALKSRPPCSSPKKRTFKTKAKPAPKIDQTKDAGEETGSDLANSAIAARLEVSTESNSVSSDKNDDGGAKTTSESNSEQNVSSVQNVQNEDCPVGKEATWTNKCNGIQVAQTKRTLGAEEKTDGQAEKRRRTEDKSENAQDDPKEFAEFFNTSTGPNISSPSKSSSKSGSYSISALCSLEQQQQVRQQEQQQRQANEQQQQKPPQQIQQPEQTQQQQIQQQEQTQQQQIQLQQQMQQQQLQQQQQQALQQQQQIQQQQEQIQQEQQKQIQEQQHQQIEQQQQKQIQQQQHIQQQQKQIQQQQQIQHQQQKHIEQQQIQHQQQKHIEQQQIQQQQQVQQQQQHMGHLLGTAENVTKPTNFLSENLAKPSCGATKVREVYVPSNEQYLEWLEKSGSKRTETRTYHGYNSFAGTMVHNSRNTFMPITESEVFDGPENTFGMSLNSADISSDLFTSLQVPNSGQHSESISPTAAFLLAFPLVSTSRATELLPDESVCDNTDSQSGMKTILQIGNIDSDKCGSNIFNVPEVGLSNFSLASQFGQSAPTHKDNNEMRNILDPKSTSADAHKDSTSGLLFKETPALLQKDGNNSSLDQFLTKSHPEHVSQATKAVHQTSEVVSQVQLSVATQSIPTTSSSLIEAKMQASNKCSSSSNQTAPQRTSAKDRREDRNVAWSSTSTQQSINTHNPFSDFTTSNPLRQDCSLNFPTLPSAIAPLSTTISTAQPYTACDVNYKVSYSQSNGNSSFSIAQSSSNIGILSWSTLPSSETYPSPRNNSKLARFHDIFPYKNSERIDVAETYTVPGGYNNGTLSFDPKRTDIQTNYNNMPAVSEQTFVQEPLTNMDARSKTTTVTYSSNPVHNNTTRSKTGVSQSSYEGPGKSCNGEKQYPANSTVVSKTSETNPTHYGHLTNAGGKHDMRTSFQGNLEKVPSTMAQYSSGTVNQKQMSDNYNKAPVDRQTANSASFSVSASVSSGKHANYVNCTSTKTAPQRTDIPSFAVSASSDPKTSGIVHFGSSEGLNVGGKKSNVNNLFNNNVGNKERPMLGSYMTNNGSTSETHLTNTSQCNQNEPNGVISQQKQQQIHKQQSMNQNQKEVQKQYQPVGPPEIQNQLQLPVQEQQQQQQGSARTSKTTMSVHRPPVNWMTAPDIRSSLQNAPAFGNNQSFYFTDHQKDTDLSVPGSIFDASNTYHCLDLPHSSGQSIYKSTDFQLFGNDQLEGIHDNSAWSPSKSNNSNNNNNNNVLGSMLIPSTLPTLVGDLALGDSSASISRPFLPTFTTDSSPCSKKTKRTHSSKHTEKPLPDGQGEFSGSFLSVSQLVDSGESRNKVRSAAIPTNRIVHQLNNEMKDGPCYPVTFPDQDLSQCQTKQNSSKCPPSSYSAEALLANPLANSQPLSRKKRPAGSAHYNNNFVTPSSVVPEVPGTFAGPQTQCNFLPDLSVPRNEYQGGLLHTEPVPPPFMIPASSCNTGGTHRNTLHSSIVPEEEMHPRRGASDDPQITSALGPNKPVSSNVGNTLDVTMGYDSNFPPFVPSVTGSMPHHPYAQETLYSAPRFQMHPNANNHGGNIQSASANTLTNFHLSTIFPEINGKVIC